MPLGQHRPTAQSIIFVRDVVGHQRVVGRIDMTANARTDRAPSMADAGASHGRSSRPWSCYEVNPGSVRCGQHAADNIDQSLSIRSADHHISGMGSSAKNMPAPSTEEATLLRLLTELEKAAHARGVRGTPKATADICKRLRKLAAELSSETGAVWHP